MNLFNQPTSSNSFFKMAQAAARNTTLVAHLIENQCQQQNITWSQLATELQISELQLAKLALCRQPGNRTFKSDAAQAARYAQIDAQTVHQFLQPASKMAFIKKTLWQKRPFLPNNSRKGDKSMIIKRALAFGVALIAIFFVSAFIFSQPASADATLQVTSGEVVVRQTSLLNQATSTVVSAGETLTVSSSDTIEVPANAAAELYLFEGSVVTLSENTVLELTELANNGSDHQIYMTLFNGHVVNRVTKLLGINDAYEVRTPSSTASVRGTVFSVEALNENATIVNVSEGIVQVTLGNEVAMVHAGEMVTAVTGQPLNVIPTNNPEMLPTATPTEEPTAAPTEEPTEKPTDTPEAEDAEAAEEQDNKENGKTPVAVPGNTPEDVPGSGNPPTGGGDPPGQSTDPVNEPNDGSNNGNTDNQGSDNADAGSGNADNGGDNGVGNDGSNNGNTDNEGSDNADSGSGNADSGGDNGVGNDGSNNGSNNSGGNSGNNGGGKP